MKLQWSATPWRKDEHPADKALREIRERDAREVAKFTPPAPLSEEYTAAREHVEAMNSDMGKWTQAEAPNLFEETMKGNS